MLTHVEVEYILLKENGRVKRSIITNGCKICITSIVSYEQDY